MARLLRVLALLALGSASGLASGVASRSVVQRLRGGAPQMAIAIIVDVEIKPETRDDGQPNRGGLPALRRAVRPSESQSFLLLRGLQGRKRRDLPQGAAALQGVVRLQGERRRRVVREHQDGLPLCECIHRVSSVEARSPVGHAGCAPAEGECGDVVTRVSRLAGRRTRRLFDTAL
eukprot:7276731-Prymnesium_polylepis.1